MTLPTKLFLALAGLSVGIALLFAFPQARGPAQARPATPPETINFRVVFGFQRTAPKNYDGHVAVSGGALRSLEPWRFLEGDAIAPPDSWKLQIRRMIFENQPDAPNSMAGGPQPQNLVPAGLFVTVDRSAASAEFRTTQGNFSVALSDLSYGRDLWFLDGDVQVERVPTAERVSPENAEEHDYPSIAVTRSGDVWTAWQAYQDRGDHVYARRRGGDPVRLTTSKGDIFRTSVAGGCRWPNPCGVVRA